MRANQKFIIYGLYQNLIKKKEIVLKKSFEIQFTDFSVFTDENRFRVKYSDKNRKINKNKDKILLIGDSLPFGWNVSYENSIAGNLDKFSNYIILNGAIPSYSLMQSRIRLEEYSKNFENIELIYFQALDPAIQYSTMKGDWTENMNWSNMNYLTYLKNKIIFKYDSLPFYGEIKIIKLAQKIYLKYFYQESKKSFADRSNDTDLMFKNHIIKELEKLYNAKNKKTVLVLGSPITINFYKNFLKKNYNDNDNILLAYDAQLKDIADKHEDIYYINMAQIFQGYSPDEVFIDNCCHFSPSSNKKIAEIILNILDNN